MALQAECDCCGESVPETELVYLERYYNQAFCHDCINHLINQLGKEIIFWGGNDQTVLDCLIGPGE